MKKYFLAIATLAALMCVSRVQGQPALTPAGQRQGPQVSRDADLEKDSLHNLEVARHYFKLRKAYVAALQRCEEIIAANPAFTKIDEVLYMAGQSSLNLADGKGKQKSSLYVIHEGDTKRTLLPDEFRDLARDYFSQLVNSHPESPFRAEAEDALRALGGPKPKTSGQ